MAIAQPGWWRVSLGSHSLGWGKALETVTALSSSKVESFGSPSFFWGEVCAAEYAKRESPLLVSVMHIRWVPLNGHLGKHWQKMVRPHFPPWLDVFFWLTNGPFSFFGRGLVIWMLRIRRARHLVQVKSIS